MMSSKKNSNREKLRRRERHKRVRCYFTHSSQKRPPWWSDIWRVWAEGRTGPVRPTVLLIWWWWLWSVTCVGHLPHPRPSHRLWEAEEETTARAEWGMGGWNISSLHHHEKVHFSNSGCLVSCASGNKREITLVTMSSTQAYDAHVYSHEWERNKWREA